MHSRRCSSCDVNWPDLATYSTCPGCDAETWRIDLSAISAQEANKLRQEMEISRRRHEAFDRFYLDRELRRLNTDLDQWAANLGSASL